MQFNPQQFSQQGQFGSDQEYPQSQQSSSYSPQQLEGMSQPPEGTRQPPSQQLPPQPYPQYPPQQQPPQGYPGQPMYAPQMQQPMYPYPPAQPFMMMPQQIVNVNVQPHQHSLFVRTLYFIFIGCWAGLIWLNIGYFFINVSSG